MNRSLLNGTMLVSGIVFSLCLILFSQTCAYGADRKIVLKKYPDFKIGFTTANFAKVLPPTATNIKKMLDFAAKQGFAFIEIRDPEARLTLEECKDLAAYSKNKHVEIVYAMNTGLLDPNFWEVFSRGIANAGVFHGPKVVRTGANGIEMVKETGKKYWNATEFAMIVENANKAANTARMFGLQFLVENAREGIKGDGITTFGTTEFFGNKGVNEKVGLQLDVANFFCTSRVPSEPGQVKSFVADHAARIGYTHLKTSKAHKPQPVLDGNELPFEDFFTYLQKNRKNYIAMELDPAAILADVYANHIKSIEYLEKNY
jgi:sugar phosphate isomerase/epimerase